MTEPELTVQKMQAYVPVSCCLLTDATGVNHCEHPPPPKPALRRRLRWWLMRRWDNARMRLGCWIAGVDLNERKEWWDE